MSADQQISASLGQIQAEMNCWNILINSLVLFVDDEPCPVRQVDIIAMGDEWQSWFKNIM